MGVETMTDARVTSARRSPVGAIAGVLGALIIVILIVFLVSSGDPPAQSPAPTTNAPADEAEPAEEPAPTEGG